MLGNFVMALKSDDNDVMVFTEIDGDKKEIKNYSDFSANPNLKDIKPEIMKIFFYVGVGISLLFVLVFLYLLIRSKPIPDYMIGFIGAIVGYFLAKRPYEI